MLLQLVLGRPARPQCRLDHPESALIVDAKALYDAAQKEHVHNRRTGIEVMVLK